MAWKWNEDEGKDRNVIYVFLSPYAYTLVGELMTLGHAMPCH